MRRALSALAALALAASLSGCFAAQTPAERVAPCLNARGFLVTPSGLRVVGTAPDGVGFTVVALTGTINDGGNPGGRALSPADRRAIRACLH